MGSPVQGRIKCDDDYALTSGLCYVEAMTCAVARPGFREILIEMMDKKAFIIPPDSYLVDSREANAAGEMTDFCKLLVQRNNIKDHTNEYVLGAVFMYNYYQVIDFE